MIYTKTGDAGTTSLIGGARVSKSHPRVEAYGSVDELCAHVALLAELMAGHASLDTYRSLLRQVQKQLFTIQTLLATEPQPACQLPFDVGEYSCSLASHCTVLEHTIDEIQASLPPLHSFVIPGGNTMSAQCHLARTVCRRAERRIVELYTIEPLSASLSVQTYINRLSDFFFVLSRHLVVSQGDKECFL